MVKELIMNVYFRMLEPVRTRLVISCFSVLLAALSNPVVFKDFVVLVLLSAEYRVPTFLVIAECILCAADLGWNLDVIDDPSCQGNIIFPRVIVCIG